MYECRYVLACVLDHAVSTWALNDNIIQEQEYSKLFHALCALMACIDVQCSHNNSLYK